ncbi:LysR family transcriptional regulator [Shewanella hanedai]|uniref:LysR family transcriptional regulator n=1 Tax=Shewanella hanedai TaxID=25 RepID=A0A553JMP6_SHEHA|nr:LysR family transcriptional regulator [Shewanella hanedai]TRY13736.1 LysR family transcriptional regulator [Shewanella hanedai]GGI87070.1 LysR family transcriptional regulator [Shewanella hanedai]
MGSFEKAQLFKLIVELGSMVATAKALNISPSAVSKRLAELESELGVQLLKRSTRSIVITEAGEHFYQEVRELGGRWQSLIDETASLGETPSGRLSVAAPAPILNRVLMPMLQGFNTRFPEIKLELLSVDYGDLPLRNADISLARHIEDFDSGAFVGVPLCEYRNGLFAAPDYIERQGMPEKIAELSLHSCLCYGKENKAYKWQLSGKSVEVKGVLVSDNTEVIIQAAVQGMGIAYIPHMIIDRELASGELIPIFNDTRSRPYVMWGYYQQLAYLPGKTRAFIDYFRESW